jgi:signal transduction histidine kinase
MIKTFFAYLKYRLVFLIFFGAATGVFLAVQFLSGQQIEFAWYTVLLTAAILLLILIPDGTAFFRKHKALRQIADLPTQYEPEFPAASNLLEEDLTEIAKGLHAFFRQAKDDLTAAHMRNLEYYTLWVHQIKTPISALRLVLQNTPDSPEKTVMLQELFGIERYTELALQYARIGNIASDLVIEQCDLDSIVRECVRKYALPFVYKRLSVEMEGLTQAVVSDAKWLRFIIEQLLSNAVKYTKEGGVKISYHEGTLTIHDTGIGIRPEDLPRIFEKGYTGYNGRVDNRASGIGLYLSKKVADALSIDIKVESSLGAGTAVKLRFPAADDWVFQ